MCNFQDVSPVNIMPLGHIWRLAWAWRYNLLKLRTSVLQISPEILSLSVELINSLPSWVQTGRISSKHITGVLDWVPTLLRALPGSLFSRFQQVLICPSHHRH